MSLAFFIACFGALAASAVALPVCIAAKKEAARWFLAAGLLALAWEAMCVGFASDSVTPELAFEWMRWALCAQACLPLPWLAFSFVYARGNPADQLRRAQWWLGGALIIPIGLVFVFWGTLIGALAQTGREGAWEIRLGLPGATLNAVFLMSAVMVLLNLERTFRASVGTMRWRIKHLVLGLAALFVTRAYTSSQTLLFGETDLLMGIVNNAVLAMGCLIMLRSLARAGNFEVSVYPSQAVLAKSFTVLLAGIYLVAVGLLTKVVTALEGQAGFALKAFLILAALVLLAATLLSDRVRLRARQLLSRHFQRPVHDYREVWHLVTNATAKCVDQGELCASIARLISEIFQALSVTVWLVDERKENLIRAASTSVSSSEGSAKPRMDSSEAREMIAALSSSAEPVDIESRAESWAGALRRVQPDQFQKGGRRICVPILSSEGLLGLINLGDRVQGVPFSIQDLDLLKSIAGHAAAGLLNMRLSQKLAQGKQLEAFQAMSAFFVHDLKNTASTLSLMLRNFPVHYQDPAFREDALRGIGRTVEHINDMISRLNSLRHELSIQAVECDLNQVVSESLKALGQTPGIEVLQSLGPLPAIRVDPAQIEKVLTNLLLNSRDALASGGQIKVETTRRDGWAVLSVSDNGCGMTSEFIQNNLFRPFQTTKKRGIGIGMFHCKMIVEAHNGRIEVESEPGKGSCFRALLPIG